MGYVPTVEIEPGRNLIGEVGSVLFLARWGTRTVRCYLTHDALVATFGAGDDRSAASSLLRAFDDNAAAIHRVARRLLGGGGRPPGAALIITSETLRHGLAVPDTDIPGAAGVAG